MAEYKPFGPPEEPSNPYAPPEASLRSDRPAYDFDGQSRMEPFSAGAAVRRAWRIFRRDPMLILGAVWCLQLMSMFYQYFAGVMNSWLAEQNPGVGVDLLLTVSVAVAGVATQLWLGVGQAIVLVNAAYERPTSLNELFSGGPFFWSYVLGTIVFGLAIGILAFAIMLPLVLISGLVALGFNGQGNGAILSVGIFLIVIGGFTAFSGLVYASIRLYLYQFLVVDRGMGGIEAISVSFQITKGRTLELFGSMLYAFLIGMSGLLMCCVGIIFTVPLGVFVLSCAYVLIASEALGLEGSSEKPAPELLL